MLCLLLTYFFNFSESGQKIGRFFEKSICTYYEFFYFVWISDYSRCPKSEVSDFGQDRFGSVVKQFRFQTLSEIRTKSFRFLMFGLGPI